MARRIISYFVIYFSLFVLNFAYAFSPVGSWKTIDDVTGEPKAIVKIWALPNHTLAGRIEHIFPRPDHDEKDLCKACSGEKHNKPIAGMIILWNFKQNHSKPEEWTEGQIFDPKNGKTYHSIIHLTDNGQKLNVRGYMGMPLFGRTQTWLRENNA